MTPSNPTNGYGLTQRRGQPFEPDQRRTHAGMSGFARMDRPDTGTTGTTGPSAEADPYAGNHDADAAARAWCATINAARTLNPGADPESAGARARVLADTVRRVDQALVECGLLHEVRPATVRYLQRTILSSAAQMIGQAITDTPDSERCANSLITVINHLGAIQQRALRTSEGPGSEPYDAVASRACTDLNGVNTAMQSAHEAGYHDIDPVLVARWVTESAQILLQRMDPQAQASSAESHRMLTQNAINNGAGVVARIFKAAGCSAAAHGSPLPALQQIHTAVATNTQNVLEAARVLQDIGPDIIAGPQHGAPGESARPNMQEATPEPQEAPQEAPRDPFGCVRDAKRPGLGIKHTSDGPAATRPAAQGTPGEQQQESTFGVVFRNII